MGNLCSKSSNEADPFSQPGRVLGASSQQPPAKTAATPQKITSSTPGRTLGGQSSTTRAEDDARSAAARAAEVSDGQKCHKDHAVCLCEPFETFVSRFCKVLLYAF